MKNILEIVGGILIFFIVGLIGIGYLYQGKDNIDNDIKKYKDYTRLKNDYMSYDYITSYDDYKDYIKEHEDYNYNKTLTKKDFKNKKYLFFALPVDSCSEKIKKDALVKVDDEYKIYLDVAYTCGVCAPIYSVYIYEVDKIDLKVKVYTKIKSREQCDPYVAYKPIIYIYPTSDIDLDIKLGNPNNLLHTYPKYKNTWHVKVTTDGNIYDYDTNRNYYGLYWEAYDNYEIDMQTGFVVKGSETVKFLEEKLAILGLNEYEINEFIIYWIDKLEGNNYNFISFRSLEDINSLMPLEFSKQPDTLIRVMMDFKPLDNYIEVEEQQLINVTRDGFTIVEWGGTKH